jgi:hypothetical protein
MLTPEYVRHHINALLRLSHGVDDPAVSAELQEMADELRIMVSVAEVAGLAADLKGIDAPSARSWPRPRPAEVLPFKRHDRFAAHHRGRSR